VIDSAISSPERHRIPHLGHVLLFLVLAVLAFLFSQAAVLGAAGSFRHTDKLIDALQNQRLQLAATTLTYLVTLIAAWFVFPALWGRSLIDGLSWNFYVVRPVAVRLAGAGLALGFLLQAMESLITMPKSVPMEDYFKTAPMVWFLTFFGTLLAPLFEETVFRGLMLPAIAIGYDWVRLPRDVAALHRWRESGDLSIPGLLFSSIITSVLFALIHAPQLGYTWAAVGLLAAVSMVLSFVRIKSGSLAASTLVHASYNLSVFITLFVASGGYRHLDKAVG
jgi:membrane protease YdiL (CAAX protease family)